MDTKTNEPEVLNGLGINWDGYVPAGGSAWQGLFDTELLPEINQMIEERKKIYNAKMFEDHDYEEANKSLNAAIENIETVKRLLGGIVGKSADLMPNQKDWMAYASENLAKIRERVLLGKGGGKTADEIANEMTFLIQFRNFVLEDRVFDKLMFGLFAVDEKYRMKVFREGYRLMQNQMDRLRQITGMQGALQDEFRENYADMLRDLTKSYEDVSQMLRLMRKTNLAALKKDCGRVNNMVRQMRMESFANYMPKFLKGRVEKAVA